MLQEVTLAARVLEGLEHHGYPVRRRAASSQE